MTTDSALTRTASAMAAKTASTDRMRAVIVVSLSSFDSASDYASIDSFGAFCKRCYCQWRGQDARIGDTSIFSDLTSRQAKKSSFQGL